MVPVQGTPKSGSHSNPVCGSGENSEVSKDFVGHKSGEGFVSGDTGDTKTIKKRNTPANFQGAM